MTRGYICGSAAGFWAVVAAAVVGLVFIFTIQQCMPRPAADPMAGVVLEPAEPVK